jgi:hypothetical protein
MRNLFIMIIALTLLLVAAPAFAQDDNTFEEGTWSAGLGGGFGDSVDIGQYVVSGKYWDPQWEIGGEVFFTNDTDNNDQIGMLWIAYRYDLSVNPGNATYVGIGGAGLFSDWNGFSNGFGPIGLVGWDSDDWGLELKWAYFDPSVISACAYYHFY